MIDHDINATAQRLGRLFSTGANSTIVAESVVKKEAIKLGQEPSPNAKVTVKQTDIENDKKNKRKDEFLRSSEVVRLSKMLTGGAFHVERANDPYVEKLWVRHYITL